jgi:predicted methyltransferase
MLPSMTKGEIVGRLVVVIDVNPSHGFWTAILMKVFGHEGKCTCRYNTH